MQKVGGVHGWWLQLRYEIGGKDSGYHISERIADWVKSLRS